jgi:hypothetical protein
VSTTKQNRDAESEPPRGLAHGVPERGLVTWSFDARRLDGPLLPTWAAPDWRIALSGVGSPAHLRARVWHAPGELRVKQITSTPHFSFAKHSLRATAPEKAEAYIDYARTYMGGAKSVDRFKRLCTQWSDRVLRTSADLEWDILLFRPEAWTRPDELVIFDGNHRAAIAAAIGIVSVNVHLVVSRRLPRALLDRLATAELLG